MKKILITDFDGTVTKKDFFWQVIDNVLGQPALDIWQEYLDYKIKHVDALIKIFSKVHLPLEEFEKLIFDIEVEECFPKTVEYCQKNDIPIYIVSAGADYYIKRILDNLNVSDKVTLISNPSYYNKNEGFVMKSLASDNQFYSEDVGVNKAAVVEKFKQEGYFCIFAGDGRPDFEAAKNANVVFAKHALFEMCKKNNLPTMNFTSYCDILNYLQNT
ncbi:MAG: MtnX-like HAD-IB family phosphatase [Candidatus Gastranaerophilales bacterium]|nr:MtnX-like HAD-IB family phosphatase [Candidatus Gastranaerophilales bacterium]